MLNGKPLDKVRVDRELKRYQGRAGLITPETRETNDLDM